MDNFIYNPESKRMIRRNGAAHKRMIKRGLMEKMVKLGANELAVIPEHATDEDVRKLKVKVEEKLPKHSHAVRGRGKYKGKLVKRSREMPAEYYQDALAKLPAAPPALVRSVGSRLTKALQPPSGGSVNQRMSVPVPAARPRSAGSVSGRIV